MTHYPYGLYVVHHPCGKRLFECDREELEEYVLPEELGQIDILAIGETYTDLEGDKWTRLE